MRKFLSYIFPFTDKIETEKNGILELTWYNGKKMLNSKNANYSYDSLQRILKYGLKQIDLTTVNSVLLLGLGGGSVIATLRKDFIFEKNIVAVEFDQAVIDIAANEFQVVPGNNLEIIKADAYEFIFDCTQQFDLIIIDLFIDTKVPQKFYSLEFWNSLSATISPKGYFIFNAALSKNIGIVLSDLIRFWESKFNFKIYDQFIEVNTLVIGQKLPKPE